jgi:hypothetical protein
MLEQRIEVRGERIVVVADRRLTGLAESAAVVGDDAVAGTKELALLPLP